jgi:hypothetical protein
MVGFAELVQGWHPDAALVLVSAAEGIQVLREIPRDAARTPVIATVAHEPSSGEKRTWLQAGVENLVSLSALPNTIAARIRRMQRGAPRAAPAPASSRPMPSGDVSAAAPIDRRRDDFPPLLVPRPPSGVPEEVRQWVDQLKPYLELREGLLGGWANGVLERYLELIHRRAMVPARADGAPPPDTLGEVHGTRSMPVAWPALIRRGPATGRSGIEVAEARIVGAGTDGITLDVPFAANPRQKLVMDIAVDKDTNAQLLLQARWQRRTGTERWLLGALVLELRLREVPTVTA